jgi:hypothetical protein
LALPAAAMAQALIGSWGPRHDVIDDDLVRMPVAKAKRSSRKK